MKINDNFVRTKNQGIFKINLLLSKIQPFDMRRFHTLVQLQDCRYSDMFIIHRFRILKTFYHIYSYFLVYFSRSCFNILCRFVFIYPSKILKPLFKFDLLFLSFSFLVKDVEFHLISHECLKQQRHKFHRLSYKTLYLIE